MLAMTAQSSSRVRNAGANSGSGPLSLSGRSSRRGAGRSRPLQFLEVERRRRAAGQSVGPVGLGRHSALVGIGAAAASRPAQEGRSEQRVEAGAAAGGAAKLALEEVRSRHGPFYHQAASFKSGLDASRPAGSLAVTFQDRTSIRTSHLARSRKAPARPGPFVTFVGFVRTKKGPAFLRGPFFHVIARSGPHWIASLRSQ